MDFSHLLLALKHSIIDVWLGSKYSSSNYTVLIIKSNVLSAWTSTENFVSKVSVASITYIGP